MNILTLTTFSLSTLQGWLTVLAPILSSVGVILFTAFKIYCWIKEMKAKYTSLEQAVQDKTELTAVKAEMATIIQQNSILRKQLEDLITATSKVKYEVPTDKKV